MAELPAPASAALPLRSALQLGFGLTAFLWVFPFC